jgi:hypothetical protein
MVVVEGFRVSCLSYLTVARQFRLRHVELETGPLGTPKELSFGQMSEMLLRQKGSCASLKKRFLRRNSTFCESRRTSPLHLACAPANPESAEQTGPT